MGATVPGRASTVCGGAAGARPRRPFLESLQPHLKPPVVACPSADSDRLSPNNGPFPWSHEEVWRWGDWSACAGGVGGSEREARGAPVACSSPRACAFLPFRRR